MKSKTLCFGSVIIICLFTNFYSQNVFAQGPGLLPDMQTVVPLHLQIQNQQQHEYLRFSNGIANTGVGDLRLRPEFPIGDITQPQLAIQEILDANGNIVSETVVSQFQYHPAHKHWHITGTALFEVRMGSPTGAVFGTNSVKTTFCLIDWYTLSGNANTKARTYFDCFGDHQGISPGWVDQYHQELDGQALDITGAPAGLYYLVSKANPDNNFIESDNSNNVAWVAFMLFRKSGGNASIEIVGHSDCNSTGLCGDDAPNR